MLVDLPVIDYSIVLINAHFSALETHIILLITAHRVYFTPLDETNRRLSGRQAELTNKATMCAFELVQYFYEFAV